MSLWLVVIAVFIAEGLNIYGEMSAARLAVPSALLNSTNVVLFVLVTIGAWLLLFAYAFGYQNVKNIWIVSAMAVTSILIIEPILAWVFFHQIPTKGSLLGLVLGAIGLITTIIWR